MMENDAKMKANAIVVFILMLVALFILGSFSFYPTNTLFKVETAFAQSISKPSIPEFTVEYADNNTRN